MNLVQAMQTVDSHRPVKSETRLCIKGERARNEHRAALRDCDGAGVEGGIEMGCE